jgi:hypothetical protein
MKPKLTAKAATVVNLLAEFSKLYMISRLKSFKAINVIIFPTPLHLPSSKW